MVVLALMILAFVDDSFSELKSALRLSDVQVNQLVALRERNAKVRPAMPAERSGDRVYNYSRRGPDDPIRKWEELAKQKAESERSLLNEEQRARVGEIASVLNQQDAAMQAVGLGILTCAQWAPTCGCYWYPIHEDKMNLGLREAQLRELERVRREHGSRDAVLAVLDPEQRAKVEAFVHEVMLANEAIEIGVIPRPERGEVLCN